MTRVIRIDDDVWAWLQKNARPLEDTANSVLRRVAGLDRASPSPNPEVAMNTPTIPPRNAASGRQIGKFKYQTDNARRLADLWGVSARHVLYHKDGNYYNHLLRFPGALFDPHGYIIFKTEDDYLKSPHLQHGQQLHVRGGISSMPGYVRKK